MSPAAHTREDLLSWPLLCFVTAAMFGGLWYFGGAFKPASSDATGWFDALIVVSYVMCFVGAVAAIAFSSYGIIRITRSTRRLRPALVINTMVLVGAIGAALAVVLSISGA